MWNVVTTGRSPSGYESHLRTPIIPYSNQNASTLQDQLSRLFQEQVAKADATGMGDGCILVARQLVVVVDDRRKPSDHDVVDALLIQDRADPNRIEHQRF